MHVLTNEHRHALFLYLVSIHSCLLCPIFSCSSAQMPSAGLIKAAPSCCHRNGLARPLASPSAGCPNHTHQRREHSCGSSRFIWAGRLHRPGEDKNRPVIIKSCMGRKDHFSLCKYLQSGICPSVFSSEWTVRLLCLSQTCETSIHSHVHSMYDLVLCTPAVLLGITQFNQPAAAMVLLGKLVIQRSGPGQSISVYMSSLLLE